MSKSNLKISKPRAYILMAAAVLAIGGISTYAFVSSQPTDSKTAQVATSQTVDSKVNDAYASISPDDIQRAAGDADIQWDPKSYQAVALVHIDSIEGGRTYSPTVEQYVLPQTYGKMTVREVYRGDIKAGEQLTYSRLGGTVTYDEYWKSLNKQQQDKILHLNKGKKPSDKKYIEVKTRDDVDVEVNKDYLVYLIPQTSKDGKQHEYLIGGAQFGLREAKGIGDAVTVLNNDTKEWEGVNSVVKQD